MPATQTPPTDKAKQELAAGGAAAQRHAQDAKAAAGSTAADVSAQASQAVDQAKHAASDAVGQARGMAAAYASEAKSQAYQMAGEAKSVARQKIAQATETGKKKASTEVNTYGAAIAKAAEELEKADEPTAPLVRSAADQLQQLGNYLETRDTKELIDSAERYARKHPELILGGMFVLGLGLARFFKSTREPLPVQSRATGGGTYGRSNADFDRDFSAGRDFAPARLSNPTGSTPGEVTVLEETTTVVPSTPK